MRIAHCIKLIHFFPDQEGLGDPETKLGNVVSIRWPKGVVTVLKQTTMREDVYMRD